LSFCCSQDDVSKHRDRGKSKKLKEALSEGVRLFSLSLSLSHSLLTAMEIPGTLHLGFLLAV